MLVRRQLKELKLKSPDVGKLTEICRDREFPEDTRCKAAYLFGTLESISLLPRRKRAGVVHALLENIREGKFRLAWCSAVSLGNLESPESVRPLLNIVRGPLRSETRRAAVHALGVIGRPAATRTLVRVLGNKHETAKMRGEAAEALITCSYGSKRVIDALTRALKSRSVEVRFFSVYALGQCAVFWGSVGERSVEAMQQLLKDRSVLQQFGSVAKETAQALSAIQRAQVRRQSLLEKHDS
jgi:hypothetical protein